MCRSCGPSRCPVCLVSSLSVRLGTRLRADLFLPLGLFFSFTSTTSGFSLTSLGRWIVLPKGSVGLLFLTRWGPQIFYDFRSVLPYVCSTDSMYCLRLKDVIFHSLKIGGLWKNPLSIAFLMAKVLSFY